MKRLLHHLPALPLTLIIIVAILITYNLAPQLLIPHDSTLREGRDTLVVTITNVTHNTNIRTTAQAIAHKNNTKILIQLHNNNHTNNIKVGATYRVIGNITTITKYAPNYRRWLHSQRITAIIYANSNNLTTTTSQLQQLPTFTRIQTKAKIIREKIITLFQTQNLTHKQLTLVSAIAFGDRSELERETREQYSQLGIAHLLALSGMHLTILYSLLSIVFVRRADSLLGKIVVLILLWLYAFLVGLPLSIVRACMMLSVMTIVTFDGRHRESINSIFVVLSVMLACNPLCIFDVGLQLSFVSLISLRFLLSLPFFSLFRRLCVCESDQLVATTLVLFYFGCFPLFTLLSNLLFVPLATIVLWVIFGALLLWWCYPLRWLLLFLLGQLLDILEGLTTMLCSGRLISINNLTISPITLLLLYALLVPFSVLLLRVKK